MELIPSIDLRRGRVVRLRQGDDARATAYAADPAALLAAFARGGVTRVHLVDLDAALGEPPQRALIERLAGLPDIPMLQIGGGLRDRGAMLWALGLSAGSRAVVGSLAAREPDGFAALAREHPGRLVPALDAIGAEVRIAGWREAAPISLPALCGRLRDLPCPSILVTDVRRDGTLDGPNLELARRVVGESGLPALVSGGVRALADLAAARELPEVAGVVVGRALYERAFELSDALAACAGLAVAAAGSRQRSRAAS
jgi:phosphoribosylformimino-5-aminoimidazole carboxamide ribotide isomerase